MFGMTDDIQAMQAEIADLKAKQSKCPEGCAGITQVKLELQRVVRMHAHRAGGAEDLAHIFMSRAGKAFAAGDDAEAKQLRDAANFIAEWAKNERQLQAKLEPKNGRFDG